MELSIWLFRLQCQQQDTSSHNISELVSLIHSPPPTALVGIGSIIRDAY